MSTVTPVMQQYLQLKSQYADSILLFQMGDFYEIFFEDAMIASKILNITLTARQKDVEHAIPMCGIPCHVAESYVARLIGEGLRVAICQQIEESAPARGLVQREVVRVVSPGTWTGSLLEPSENSYLAGMLPLEEGVGLALLDLSTGEFRTAEYRGADYLNRLKDGLCSLEPRELLIPKGSARHVAVTVVQAELSRCVTREMDDGVFQYEQAYGKLLEHFGVQWLDRFPCAHDRMAIAAAGAVLQYVGETQRCRLDYINRIVPLRCAGYMDLDLATVRNLELVKTAIEHAKTGSLLWLLDKTQTPMGARRLRNWVLQPLCDVQQIQRRLAVVEELKTHHMIRQQIRERLQAIVDLERVVSRLHVSAVSPKDLAAMKRSAETLPVIQELLHKCLPACGDPLLREWDNLHDIASTLELALVSDPPADLREGGVLKDGYDEALDRLRAFVRAGKGWLLALEKEEREKTGIPTLKVGYHKVFGYYIEVTHRHQHAVPPSYIRKQTLATAERYVTQALKEREQQLLDAEEQILNRERELFRSLISKLAGETRRIQAMAEKLAELDALQSLAEVAARYQYVKPCVSDGEELRIVEGRHPLVEQRYKAERFVPNDTDLDARSNRMMIITGPNMAGKSTYLRQVGLIVLMAQIGSFVPAREARIGVVDRLFTRVGASDNLVRGESTFMVEMLETANILHNATPRSLILLDEIGRGTGTLDGISVAWAVLEKIWDKKAVGARTICATHYHELVRLGETLEGVNNYKALVREWNEEIMFLRRIVKGATDKSYGIHVAKLAGIPRDVVERAQAILHTLETARAENRLGMADEQQESRGSFLMHEALDLIRDLDPNRLTPFEALALLQRLQPMVSSLLPLKAEDGP